MSKHTPGPWRPERDAEELRVYGQRDCLIACVGNAYSHPADDEANAHVIAAAPDLLEALKGLVADTEEYVRINNLYTEEGGPAIHNHWMVIARAAIAKATGAE